MAEPKRELHAASVSEGQADAARKAISAIFFVSGSAMASYLAHLSDVKRRFAISDQQLGLVLLASALGAVTTMPLAGPLIHRFGSRNLAVVAMLTVCFGVPVLYMTPSVPTFAVFLFFLGASIGQMDVGMNTHSIAVQRHFDRPMLSAVHGWFCLGGFVGGGGVSLAHRFGVEPVPHLWLTALLLASVVLLSGRHLLPSSADQGGERSGLALPHGRLWIIGVLITLSFIAEGSLWDWSAIYLRDSRQTAPWVGPFGFGLASLAMAVGRFFGDGLIHQFGRLGVLRASTWVAGVGLVLAIAAPSVPLSILGFVLAGVGLANAVPILFQASTLVPGVAAGYGLAAVTTCGYGGFLAGPPAIGMLAKSNSLGIALGVVAGLCWVVALLSPLALPTDGDTRYPGYPSRQLAIRHGAIVVCLFVAFYVILWALVK